MEDTKQKGREEAGACLPLSKIRTIMKSSPDIELVSQESLPIVCRATEMFIQHFITQAYIYSKDKRTISYADVAEAVGNEENLSFLSDILPHKRLAGECVDLKKRTHTSGAASSPSKVKEDTEPQR